MEDLSASIIQYLSLHPNAISIDRDKCKGKARYRVRIIFRGEMDFLKDITTKYCNTGAEIKKEREPQISKRCGQGKLILSDGECEELLNVFGPLLTDNPRVVLCRRLLDAKRIGRGGSGRGNKTSVDHAAIYEEYLKLK